MRRIVYIQYTNPAAYPPLLHSSTILAEQGWEVLFLGIAARGAAQVSMPSHPRIHHEQLGRVSGGASGPIKYGTYAARALLAAKRFRADWCYASDALSAPVALACQKLLGLRVLYHEHDAPAPRHGVGPTVVVEARNRLARSAHIVIAPSQQRLALVPTGHGQRFTVSNCPRIAEVADERTPTTDHAFRLVYQGSLSRDRLTPQFIDALGLLPEVELHVVGYETEGHRGYADELQQRARAADVAARFFYHGVITQRTELLQRIRGYDLGIATVDPRSTDLNLRALAGASNKAFEYLSAGMPLLVSEQREWQEMFVTPGYAVACQPTDPASIAAAVRSLMRDRERSRTMGAAGRRRIVDEWNYETQFAPVRAALEH